MYIVLPMERFILFYEMVACVFKLFGIVTVLREKMLVEFSCCFKCIHFLNKKIAKVLLISFELLSLLFNWISQCAHISFVFK